MSENYFMGLDGFVWFTGVVEDRNDPDKLGRVRVRCLGFHTEDLIDIPTADLPWANVMHPVTNPSMQGLGQTPSFLVEGTWVVGFFTDAKEKQQPIIMGTLPGKPSTAPDDTKGFSDPNKVYPSTALPASGHGTFVDGDQSSDYNKGFFESDTNRLARNDDLVDGKGADDEKYAERINNANTLHKKKKKKEDTRTKNIPIANTTDDETDSKQNEYDEPRSAYGALYPKNHVFETESGHIKEYDDTPNDERIHEYHTSGTFTEINAGGDKVTRVVKDNFEIVIRDNFVNIKGSCYLTIDTDCKTYIKGNWDIQVDGNVNEVIKGTMTQTITGAVTETYSDVKTETVTGAVTEVYKATQDTDVTGNITVDGSTINLNNGTKGAARLDDTVDTGDDPAGISGSDGSNKIESSSATVIIGD